MHILHRFGHVVGGTLLIAATTIGVGMLGLPIATGPGGFLPASSVYVLVWFFMLCTGLLLLEVCIWMPNDANFITMTHRLLGPVGKGVCWALYLFLFIAAMVAHVSGGGGTLSDLTGGSLPHWASMIVYVLIFSPIIYFGTQTVDRANLILMVGVLGSYLLFVLTSATHVDTTLLKFADWSKALPALPILFAAFTYQLIIPTLMTYMNRNVKKVRLAIILGSSIPLVVYLVWEALILGIVPVDHLVEAQGQGHTAVMPLKQFLDNPLIFRIGNWFAFFVLTTSYLALALAFLDFLADGLKIKKIGVKKVFLCLLIFTPPTLIALAYPGIFLKALGYVGGVSCAILFGLFPPLMAWKGRYIKGYSLSTQQLPGGKAVLSILILFVIFELVLEVMNQFQ